VPQKVLIVEDEPNIAETLRFLLMRAGFEVQIEPDGGRALGRVTGDGADIVILDVMLPNRSGFDILRDLRGTAGPQLPVLMLTAKGQARDRETAEALGVTRFMTKPFSNAELVDAVRSLAEAGVP
jgi:DNA-binding response OmpR family regulator